MIEIEDLSKRYGQIEAVRKISFRVEPGEVLGFLGPNGAGKSTTMKMIAGFVEPSHGRALVDGMDVSKQPIECKKQIGYLPEGAPCYGEMSPASFLSFIADMRGMTSHYRSERIAKVVEQLHLGPVLHQSIETLSKGFKRRVGLAQAILHDPKILILDEPTDGLDPNQKHEVRNLIKEMSAEKIIIVSTHILEEVSSVCTRAIIIARGQLLADETPASLQAQAPQHNRILVELEQSDKIKPFAQALGNLADVSAVTLIDGSIAVDPENGQNLLSVIANLAKSEQVGLANMTMHSGLLDQVFRQITQPSTPKGGV